MAAGLVVRRSADGGVSWTPPVTVYAGDLDFYTVVREQQRNVLWLMVQQGSQVQLFNSSTAGATWNGPFKMAFHVPAGIAPGVIPAVGHGIQLQADRCSPAPCQEAGRLVMPFVCNNATAMTSDTGCTTCHACLLLSDDLGFTWYFGGVGQSGSRESQVGPGPGPTRIARTARIAHSHSRPPTLLVPVCAGSADAVVNRARFALHHRAQHGRHPRPPHVCPQQRWGPDPGRHWD